jgi:polysaccharide export outer membrane protein
MSKLFLNISASLLKSGYSIEFHASGKSMYPTIRDGELITVQPVTISEVKNGDIVLYRNEKGVIAHRVVHVNKPNLLLRGDSSNTLDAPVMPDQILGKVISTKRAGRKIRLNKLSALQSLHARVRHFFWKLMLAVLLLCSVSIFADTASIDNYIGPEDLLEITVFELPQFNVTSRVSGDGTVTMPLIGSVEVKGLSKKDAEKKIAAALETKYVNNASVSINIKEYKSKQVSILGAVKNPGAYYILSDRTVLQLLSDAGGLVPQAGKKCFVFRSGASKIEIDLDELMNSGNEKLNISVKPGDVINVPLETTVIVYVLGAVRSPGAIEMTTSLPVTLVAAIAKAGGLTEEANKSNIQIRRKDDKGADTVIKVNFKDILKGKTADVVLHPGDAINVPETFF